MFYLLGNKYIIIDIINSTTASVKDYQRRHTKHCLSDKQTFSSNFTTLQLTGAFPKPSCERVIWKNDAGKVLEVVKDDPDTFSLTMVLRPIVTYSYPILFLYFFSHLMMHWHPYSFFPPKLKWKPLITNSWYRDIRIYQVNNTLVLLKKKEQKSLSKLTVFKWFLKQEKETDSTW